ncbi:MAG: C40 family peptidase [Muribaculaceae bacterium]|nr:C40 family peptidase [Muribaculaceae bacterium]
MKLINLFTILLTCACSFGASAQTDKTLLTHNAVHDQLLAKAKSSHIDKTVIKDLIKQDVERREEASSDHDHLSSETAMLINDLLSEANSHMGKRYRSGAKGPKAFDCSGFSSYVFRQFGYSLGASSRDQYVQGEAVEKQNLRKGDLVFFTGRNSKSNRVGHVGIVVSADNENGTFKFIHASTSQGIKIDSNDGYYSRRYIGARRIIVE